MRDYKQFWMRASLLCCAAFSVSGVRATSTRAQEHIRPGVVIGVLEDEPGRTAGQVNHRAVRAVFEKQGRAWRAFPSDCPDEKSLKAISSLYPAKMEWTVAFDGRDLGTIASRTPASYDYYSEVGLEAISSHGPVPTIGARSETFAGFLDRPVLRPMVTVSQPNFRDPDRWKRARISAPLLAAVRAQFRTRFPQVSNCRDPEQNARRPWKYGDNDIALVKAYSSRTGWSLVGVSLTGYDCDGPIDDPQGDDSPYAVHWYVSDPSGRVRFLGADMQLIDAGDYDGDGSSEVLFSVDGYAKGGYRLFYAGFRRSADFTFNYN